MLEKVKSFSANKIIACHCRLIDCKINYQLLKPPLGKYLMSTDITIKIAGAAGQGMQTIGFILGKVLTRSGLHVFAVQDNESRIRGGHNFFQLRTSKNPVLSMSTRLDVLVALNQNSVDFHQEELSKRGVIVFDNEQIRF